MTFRSAWVIQGDCVSKKGGGREREELGWEQS
jgi:hypothetical protein